MNGPSLAFARGDVHDPPIVATPPGAFRGYGKTPPEWGLLTVIAAIGHVHYWTPDIPSHTDHRVQELAQRRSDEPPSI